MKILTSLASLRSLTNVQRRSTPFFLKCGACAQPKFPLYLRPVIWSTNSHRYSSEARQAEKKLRKEVKQKLVSNTQAKKKLFQEALYTGKTGIGDKKDVSIDLPNTYSPRYVEAAWYDWWEKEGFFMPNPESSEQFVLCLPPPNVTGSLHLGHALGNSIQDAICRWHRMHGRSVLWNPGCDHAGIATQVVVEKELWKEKKLTRHDLGREAFIEEVWKWKESKGGTIFSQMKKLGSSLDWSRACFTLDQKLSNAVTEAFVRLHDENVIYRSRRLVNWSCTLKSAISDIEVDNLSLDGPTKLKVPGYESKIPFGEMITFEYPIHDSDEAVLVATTRIETMLGDTGIAVHPDDERYSSLHGKQAVHPFTGKLLPIVCDSHVQPDMGTGVVKLTPAHDHNDFDIGKRHSLDSVDILDDTGCLINVPEPFLGMPRFKARFAVLKALKEINLFKQSSPHAMVIPICSRSGDVIEPCLKPQWYVNCKQMAEKAIEVVESGDLQLIPNDYNRQWFEWLENIRDWCISRQLWWGHRIPAYRVIGQNEVWFSGRNIEEARKKASRELRVSASEIELEQDADVLDTWFSSALFPFSIFGWPQKTDDMQRFFPTTLLETASDIMFFWVARMVMMSDSLLGTLPFKQVLFHSVLRDAHGRKMSKSLGNVIDPMDVIHGISLEDLNERLKKSNLDPKEISLALKSQQKDFPQGIPECGADALRFSLCSYNHKSNFVNVDINHIHFHRKFCNKIWQAFKLVSLHLGPKYKPRNHLQLSGSESATDLWMLSMLAQLVQSCDAAFASYDLNHATAALIDFWWNTFCDIYLEYAKEILRNGEVAERDAVLHVMHMCVDYGLRALSPFMPFLCEELYQRLPQRRASDSVCTAPYPRVSEVIHLNQPQLHAEMQHLKELVSAALKLRRDLNLTKLRAHVYISTSSEIEAGLNRHLTVLTVLSRSAQIHFISNGNSAPNGCCASEVSGQSQIFMHIKDLIDVEEELRKLEATEKKHEAAITKLSNKIAKMDADSYSIEQEKLKEMQQAMKSTQRIIESLKNL